MNAPLPPDESERLDALRRYAVLDTPPEAAFDEIAALAARLCGAPHAAVTLVDAGRQWFKAVVGVSARETPREESICAHVVWAGEPLQVPDASKDSRFAEMSQVRGEPHVRFYASVPLRASSGHVLGTLCVFDRRARTLSAEQMEMLRVLAAQVMAQLELRRHVHEQARTESALLGILEDQRSAEEALRRSEREQRALAERLAAERASLVEAQTVAKMGGWETDLATLAVRWSEQTHRIFETDPASMSPSHALFLEFVHPEDRAAVDEAFHDSMAGEGETRTIEHRVLVSGGRVKHVEERWRIVFGADGMPARAVGTCQDITERVLAQAEQTRLAERLAETLETITDAFLTIDREWRVTYANGEATRLLRRERDELVGREIWEVLPHAPGTPFEDALRRAATERVTVKLVEYYPPFDQWLGVRVFFSAQGLAVYLSDVSELHRAEAQLRLFENSIARLNDMVMITRATPVEEPGPEIVFVNEAFERITGYTRAEALGRSPRFLQGPKTQRAALDRIREGIAAGRAVHEELINYGKDGREYWVDMNISPVADACGVVTHLVAVERDITERKKLEDQFLRAQRMESIGTLAGGIAHDLNNLLAPILMGVELIRRLEPREDTHRLLLNMERSARRGAELVKQVLSFARGVEGARVSVHLRHIVGELESIVANTFPKNIVLESNLSRDLLLVTGDPTQLNQVLLNLAVNARDAMPSGGRLSISARNVEIDAQYAVMNRGVAAGRHVLLEVADTGAGMTREVIDRIFEPFFTTKEVGAGTGLGLSTVLGIVRSHGGFVNVYSEPGHGSVFKVYLPAQAATGADATVAEGATNLPRGAGELVLIVDDEVSILSVTRQTVEAFGYRALTAEDGAQAIGLYAQRQGEIRAILTDMMMPVMDGLALIEAVRRISPDVPVIAASGLNTNGHMAKATALGIQHFLAKPYTTEALLTVLHRVLAGKPS